MAELIKQNYDVIKVMTPREEAIKIFEERESYKLQLINDMPGEDAFGLIIIKNMLICAESARTKYPLFESV